MALDQKGMGSEKIKGLPEIKKAAIELSTKFSYDALHSRVNSHADWDEQTKKDILRNAQDIQGIINEIIVAVGKKKITPDSWPNKFGYHNLAFLRVAFDRGGTNNSIELHQFDIKDPLRVTTPATFISTLEELSQPPEDFGVLFEKILPEIDNATSLEQIAQISNRISAEYPKASSKSLSWLEEYSDQKALTILTASLSKEKDIDGLTLFRDSYLLNQPYTGLTPKSFDKVHVIFSQNVIRVVSDLLTKTPDTIDSLISIQDAVKNLLNNRTFDKNVVSTFFKELDARAIQCFKTLLQAISVTNSTALDECEDLQNQVRSFFGTRLSGTSLSGEILSVAASIVNKQILRVDTLVALEQIQSTVRNFNFPAMELKEIDALIESRAVSLLEQTKKPLTGINELAQSKGYARKFGGPQSAELTTSIDARGAAYFANNIRLAKDVVATSKIRQEILTFPFDTNEQNLLLMRAADKVAALSEEKLKNKLVGMNQLVTLKSSVGSYFIQPLSVTESTAFSKILSKIDTEAQNRFKLEALRAKKDVGALEQVAEKARAFPFSNDVVRQETLNIVEGQK